MPQSIFDRHRTCCKRVSPPWSGARVGFLVHKRCKKSLLRRHIHGLILNKSYFDHERSEIVCRVSRVEIIDLLPQPIDLHVVPNIEKGEVLIDSLGQGSFQRTTQIQE